MTKRKKSQKKIRITTPFPSAESVRKKLGVSKKRMRELDEYVERSTRRQQPLFFYPKTPVKAFLVRIDSFLDEEGWSNKQLFRNLQNCATINK